MKIFVTGTRGIPEIPGGVEKHCQELYPLISDFGHTVILATRASYSSTRQKRWRGVHLYHLWAPKNKYLEAIVHTFVAVFLARILNSDIIHIHAVGPGLAVPLARLLGLKVVFTNHGPDYKRQKWNRLAKWILQLGEWLANSFSNQIIVISSSIAEGVLPRHRPKLTVIHNGVTFPGISRKSDYLEKIGVRPLQYILAVGRLVPEKGLHDLIAAFRELELQCKLVLVGDADHESDYSRKLKQSISENDNIVQTGYLKGERLNQVYSHARLFVLPSYHEGLPISLLEALSYGINVLVSDIPANLELNLLPQQYFQCGNVLHLKERLSTALKSNPDPIDQADIKKTLIANHDWPGIATQTASVFEKTLQL